MQADQVDAVGTGMVDGRREARVADGRLRVLDGLRFVAAMAVVLFHFTGREGPAWDESVRDVFPLLSRFTLYGGFGPYLFFMISGFVVLMSAWGRPVHSFVASRVGRLYPAYWFAVVLTAAVLLVHPIAPMWQTLGLPGVAINLTMFQSAFGVAHVDGVYWTLWVELKFYLLLVLMILLGITRRRLLALCLVWPVVGAVAAQSQSVLLVNLLEPMYAPFFCIGILLYLVHREGWSISAALLLGLNYLFALWVCAAHYIPWSVALAGAPVSFRGIALLLTASVIAIGIATLTPVSRVDWRWLTLLGALTYPLYLVHQYPGWVLIGRLRTVLSPGAAVTCAVLAAVVAAYLVHRFVERPLGGRLRRAVEDDLGPNLPARARTPIARADLADLVSRPVRRQPHQQEPHGSPGLAQPGETTVGDPVPHGTDLAWPHASAGGDRAAVARSGQLPVERHSRERSAVT